MLDIFQEIGDVKNIQINLDRRTGFVKVSDDGFRAPVIHCDDRTLGSCAGVCTGGVRDQGGG